MVIDKNGSISVNFPGGILGFSSNSLDKWFDIWCDYFYFSVVSLQPCVKENQKEYVHSYFYLVNPFGIKKTKIINFSKFIILIETESYARN